MAARSGDGRAPARSHRGTPPALAACLALCAASAAQGQVLPPDVVSTVFVSDSIEGYGATGGVAVDALGFVYVADFANSVWRIAPDGSVRKFADGLYGASGNAIGPRGYLYQSSFYGNYVSRISRNGVVETWADEGLAGPVGIAVSPGGELFVANCSADTISRIGRDRSVVVFARSDLMACPNGITFDDRGDLYVVNFNNTKVLRIDEHGDVTELADLPAAGGNGHITFARGVFFITKNRDHRVYRLRRDGAYTVLAGTGEAGEADGPAHQATFTRPNGIAAGPGGDELWVNDLTQGQGLGRGVSVVSMRRIRLVSLAEVLGALDPDADAEALRSAHAAYQRARSGEDSSASAIALGYQWLTAGRLQHAVTLFELNAASYPGDANAQYHFGEALRFTGSPGRAAEQYRRALDLDPDHPTARGRLALVTGA